LSNPRYLAMDVLGNLYISDAASNVVRRVDSSTGVITTAAGSGVAGYSGDGGLATGARLKSPAGVAVDAAGNLYISDNGNYVVREVNKSTGIITTTAGNGTLGTSGNGGLPTSAQLGGPEDLVLDAAGDLYIADYADPATREVNAAHSLIVGINTGSEPQLAINNQGDLYSDYSLFYVFPADTSSLSFNAVAVHGTATQSITFMNAGTAALTISNIAISGSNASEFTETGNCVETLQPGSSCTVSVVFTPSALGTRTATMTISDSTSGSPHAVTLTGVGQDPLTLTGPSGVSASPNVGTSQTYTISSTGAAVTIDSITLTPNANPFSETNNCGTNLAAGASCTVTLTIAPTAIGIYASTLKVSYDGGLASAGIYVTLTVAAPPAVSVFPTPAIFASQSVGLPSTQMSIEISNPTSTPITVSGGYIDGTNANDFAELVDHCGTIPADANCTVSVVFFPHQTGYKTARLVMNTNIGALTVPLIANGVLTSYQGNTAVPGNYEIVNSLTGKALDVAAGSSANGATVQQWAVNGFEQQQWQFVPLPIEGFTIRNTLTGGVLDVTGLSTSNGAAIQQWQSTGAANQQWQLLPVDDVHYQIVNVNSGKVIEVADGSAANGAEIRQWDYTGSPQQLWVLIPRTTFAITNVFSGNVLDISAGSLDNGAPVQQWQQDGKHQQEWQLMPVGAGYYALINRLTGKVLDDTGFSTSNGTTMQQWDYVGGTNQQWQLVLTGAPSLSSYSTTYTFKFVNRLSGKVLDDTGFSLADGTTVQQWDDEGGSNQQWQLTPVVYYSIANVYSNAVLDVPMGSAANGTLIQQWAFDGLQQQQWQFVPVGGAYYAVINDLTGKALDDTAFSMSNGTKIQQWDYLGGANQQWQFLNTNGGSCFPLANAQCVLQNRFSGKVLDDTGFSKANGTLIQQYDASGASNQSWSFAVVPN